MKGFVGVLLVLGLLVYSASAEEVEKDNYQLSCEVGAVCFQRELKKAQHSFNITPGSIIKVEIVAKNGAAVSLQSGGSSVSASLFSIGGAEQKVIPLQTQVAQTGIFMLNVQPVNVKVNGMQEGINSYSVKITRIAVGQNDNVPGESI